MHFAVDKLGQSRRLFIACHSHTYCTYFWTSLLCLVVLSLCLHYWGKCDEKGGEVMCVEGVREGGLCMCTMYVCRGGKLWARTSFSVEVRTSLQWRRQMSAGTSPVLHFLSSLQPSLTPAMATSQLSMSRPMFPTSMPLVTCWRGRTNWHHWPSRQGSFWQRDSLEKASSM